MQYSEENFYRILNVDVNSTSAEIKTAYRKLARKYHPDVNKAPDAIEKFKKITTAYQTLSNPQERERYNILKGIFQTPKSSASPQKAREEYEQNLRKQKEYQYKSDNINREQNTPQPPEKESKKQGGIFTALKYWALKLKKHKRERDNKKPQKGQNITTEINITPEEAISGCKRVVNVLTTQTCPKCGGRRFINGGTCPECAGSGEISARKKITVTVPKGVKNGSKLRLKGEGGLGKNGGACGDLFINILTESDSNARKDKLNIYRNLPISPFEAVLGADIKIPTQNGSVRLKLPKNTNSGQKFRIAEHGLEKNGKIGDLILTVSIEISLNLSDDEIKLYEKLKNLSKDNIRKNSVNG